MKLAFGAAVGWGIQPSEFWAMPVADWWALFDLRRTDVKAGAVDWQALRNEHAEKQRKRAQQQGAADG